MGGPFAPEPFDGFGFMFSLMSVIMPIGFIVFLILFVRAIAGNVRNARAPRQTWYARVATKRMEVWGDHSRTHYYITLEFGDGGRREYLDVKNLYGLLVEGDEGYATVQGDWIVAFERHPAARPHHGAGW